MGESIKVTEMSGTEMDIDFMGIESIEQRRYGTIIKFQDRNPLSVKESREEVMERIAKCLGV